MTSKHSLEQLIDGTHRQIRALRIHVGEAVDLLNERLNTLEAQPEPSNAKLLERVAVLESYSTGWNPINAFNDILQRLARLEDHARQNVIAPPTVNTPTFDALHVRLNPSDFDTHAPLGEVPAFPWTYLVENSDTLNVCVDLLTEILHRRESTGRIIWPAIAVGPDIPACPLT